MAMCCEKEGIFKSFPPEKQKGRIAGVGCPLIRPSLSYICSSGLQDLQNKPGARRIYDPGLKPCPSWGARFRLFPDVLPGRLLKSSLDISCPQSLSLILISFGKPRVRSRPFTFISWLLPKSKAEPIKTLILSAVFSPIDNLNLSLK